ncbi:MAG: flagellar assembly protein FliW [Clostridia bacterium]|nr:flagellar assembly protein FliW [Clostridia bacterium]
MLLNTKNFGEVEIKDDDIIFFEYGVPGFENMTKFVILGKTDAEDDPFFWLQSVQNPNLAFVIMDPRDLVPDYEAEIDTFTANMLKITDPNDALIYCIVTVPQDIQKISINLKAPVIINAKENRGCQVVQESDKYKFKHIITEEFVKA